MHDRLDKLAYVRSMEIRSRFVVRVLVVKTKLLVVILKAVTGLPPVQL